MENTRKRSPCSRIFQDLALEGGQKAAWSHTCQQDTGFPKTNHTLGSQEQQDPCVVHIVLHATNEAQVKRPHLSSWVHQFPSEKGREISRKSMDGTTCSQNLEGSKCYFKGVPENFYGEGYIQSVSLSVIYRSEKCWDPNFQSSL